MIRCQSASFRGENDPKLSRVTRDLFSSCFTTIVPQVRLLECWGVVVLVLLAYTYAAIGMPVSGYSGTVNVRFSSIGRS